MGKAKKLIEGIVTDNILKGIILDLEKTKLAEQHADYLITYFCNRGDKENELKALHISLELSEIRKVLERKRGK